MDCSVDGANGAGPTGPISDCLYRQVPLSIPDDDGKAALTSIMAWAVLSATFSETRNVKIDYRDRKLPDQIAYISFHQDPEQLVTDALSQLEREILHAAKIRPHDPESAATTMAAAVNGPTYPSGLPRVLVADGMDDKVCSFIARGEHSIVFGVDAERQARPGFAILKIHYSRNLREMELDWFIGRMTSLAGQLHAAKTRRLKDLDLLSPIDRARLSAWNEWMPLPTRTCTHELIEHQAKINPWREAVRSWDGSFTYEELNERASCLARILVAKGIRVGDTVPLLFEKSKWHVVSMIATLKAGAAFVALEHTIPDGRIAMLVKQLDRVPLALCCKQQQDRLSGVVHQAVIVDQETVSVDNTDVPLPVPGAPDAIQDSDAAYVIFTSGSTGLPKGAIIEHAQLSTSMLALNALIGATSEMRSLQMTAFNFDLSISEIFCPLLCGGCLCLPSEWSRFNDLAGAVDSLDANFASFSPSFLATLAEKDFSKIKTILLAGERVPRELTNFWTGHGRRMVHMYGPTECTVGCCFIDANARAHYDGYIGDSYASRMWIIDPDDDQRLMPVGAPGELLVEGPVVGRCYLDPERTRASFIEAPAWFGRICERPSTRFYKTGDLGRQRPDGGYEIIGRKDTQTKIRGLRVEIQEIEHQIRKAINSKTGAAVEVRNPDRVPGHEMLLAFLELEPRKILEEKIDLEILWDRLESSETSFPDMADHVRAEVAKVLPNYMCPSAYIPIKSLPFTNSYKLNRLALKDMANSMSTAEIQRTLSTSRKKPGRPLTQEEQTLREIWAGALQTLPENLDVQDDFFHVGGDSLKAMAVVSAARRHGLHLSVAKLYKLKTIEGLARNAGQQEVYSDSSIEAFSLLEADQKAGILEEASQQCSIATRSIQDIMPVTDMQEFYLANQKLHPRSWMVRCAFDLPVGLDPERLKRAWEQLMAQYPITRTRFIHSQHGFFQVILASEVVRWRHEVSFPPLDRALDEEDLGFGLQPHVSALLLNAERIPTRLVWFVNHAISDHLMNEQVSQDLASLYADQTYSIPVRPSFKSVVSFRLKKPSSSSFWRSHLCGARYTPLLSEHQTHSKLANGTLILNTGVSIPRLQNAAVKVSEYAVVITALALALSRETGNTDIPFLLMRSGRIAQISGAEEVVGPLLARSPLRISIAHAAAAMAGTNGEGRADSRYGLFTLLQHVQDDFEACSMHEIVSEAAFRSAAPEAAEHLTHACVLNFTPPTAGLTVESPGRGSWTHFPVENDLRDGAGHKNRVLDFFGEITKGQLCLHVVFQEEAVAKSRMERVLATTEKVIRLLGSEDENVTVDQALKV